MNDLVSSQLYIKREMFAQGTQELSEAERERARVGGREEGEMLVYSLFYAGPSNNCI